ncbi:hypothetical protein K2W90_01415 [Candidatus Babeliales bacterium]|nr:hypothetical protein [Candidatus Babeliales bacterium]
MAIFLAVSFSSNGYTAAHSEKKQAWLAEFDDNKEFFITTISQRFNGDPVRYLNKFIKESDERTFFLGLTGKYFIEFQQAFFDQEAHDYNLEKLRVYVAWLVEQQPKSSPRKTWEERALHLS